MRKKLYVAIGCFLLICAVMIYVSPETLAQGTEITVADEPSLKAAVANPAYDVISIDGDITLSAALVISRDIKFAGANKTVALYVNGDYRHMSVKKDSGGDIVLEFDGVELVGRKTSPEDTTPGGGIVITRTPANPAAANRGNTINTLYLINAVIKDCHIVGYGGGIGFTWPQGQPEIDYCDLNISGAKTVISGNSAARGGGVAANHITIEAGEISGNNAVYYAGAGVARGYAGGVYAYGGLTMNGGIISGNQSNAYGGGSANYHGGYAINGGVITGNKAGMEGGGVYSYSYLTITNGAIEGNEAGTDGGGVYAGEGVAVTGGSVTNNTAAASGGGVFASASFQMSAGGVRRNTAGADGGGVYVSSWNADFNALDAGTYTYNALNTISGGTISSNTAGVNGGGVYAGRVFYNAEDISTENFTYLTDIDFTMTLLLSGGTVSGNTAANNGGGLYGETGDTISASGAEISGNITLKDGGGVWIWDLDYFSADGVTFSGNRASAGYVWDINNPSVDIQVADAATHKNNIINTSYTNPFTNAYSNFDVNYSSGTLYVEIPPLPPEASPPQPEVLPPEEPVVLPPEAPEAPEPPVENPKTGDFSTWIFVPATLGILSWLWLIFGVAARKRGRS